MDSGRKKGRDAEALESVPGVGRSIAQDLRDLGFRKVSDLRRRDPERMYRDLCRLRGASIDRCQLYVFRCAVYYASRPQHRPELLKWWNWKDGGTAFSGRRR
jgi:Pathogenicity locus